MTHPCYILIDVVGNNMLSKLGGVIISFSLSMYDEAAEACGLFDVGFWTSCT